MHDLGFVRTNLELVEKKLRVPRCLANLLHPVLCSLSLQIISPFCWTIIL